MTALRPEVVRGLVAVMTDVALPTSARVERAIRMDATDDEVSFALGTLVGLAATSRGKSSMAYGGQS